MTNTLRDIIGTAILAGIITAILIGIDRLFFY